MESYNVAVVGATGAVGNEIFSILEERNFPIDRIVPLASEASLGKYTFYKGKDVGVEALKDFDFSGIDIAFFTAGRAVSLEYVPKAVEAGAVVIDNTSAYRQNIKVPLVVPEVNPHKIKDYNTTGIIANPNCSTIQMVVALKPIHDRVGIKRVVVSTYQAVSGAGLRAMDELSKQTIVMFSQGEAKPHVFLHQIAFNCIPRIDDFVENGYTKEEMKMSLETAKIMGDDSIKVTATAVRVPVFSCHSEAVNIETRNKISAQEVKDLLKTAPGLELMDDVSNNVYPMPVDATGKDSVYVGRIREDVSLENGINLWIVADNIRKGAALNAVQIAEILIKEYLK